MALCPLGDGHHGGLAPSFGNKRFLLAAIDYFTEWVEAEPLVQIREMGMIRFIKRNILFAVSIPRAFI